MKCPKCNAKMWRMVYKDGDRREVYWICSDPKCGEKVTE